MLNPIRVSILAGLAFVSANLQAQLLFNGTLAQVDFDSTVPGVGAGGFLGTGFAPAPAAGQLDSDAWAITGASEGDLAFGGTAVTGDYARGSDGDGVSTGGVYAFEVGGAADVALGFQATNDDFTPGTLTLRVRNGSGGTLTDLVIGYEIYCLNNGDRANSLNFSYSLNGSSFLSAPALDYGSPETADSNPTWAATDRSLALSSLAWPDGTDLYLRWESDDIAGGGSRDELAIDNLVLSVPEPAVTSLSASLALLGLALWRHRRVGASRRFPTG